MDNFDLKQYLVENKLTYQEKMKDKAKKLKESETLINEITVEYSPELEKEIGMKFDVKSNYGGEKGTSSIADKSGKILGYYMEPNAKEYSVSKTDSLFGKKVYQALADDNEFGKFLKTKKEMKEAETTSKPKEQEKGHQAPKDKSKQGPSSLNEGKVFFSGY